MRIFTGVLAALCMRRGCQVSPFEHSQLCPSVPPVNTCTGGSTGLPSICTVSEHSHSTPTHTPSGGIMMLSCRTSNHALSLRSVLESITARARRSFPGVCVWGLYARICRRSGTVGNGRVSSIRSTYMRSTRQTLRIRAGVRLGFSM